MMDFITIPLTFGIVTLGIYKLFELYACRKERLLMIEKLGDKCSADILKEKIYPSLGLGKISFSALKLGCLLMGLGLGLLLAFFIHCNMMEFVEKDWTTRSVIYGSCVLLFGGLGLLIAFLVELNVGKKE